MNDKEKKLIEKMIENNKKQIQKAQEIGDIQREYFHEGSVSALEAVFWELNRDG
jgi:hypothetical protein